jgi:hypothetical protein
MKKPVRILLVGLNLRQVDFLSGIICELSDHFALAGCSSLLQDAYKLLAERRAGLLIVNGQAVSVSEVQDWKDRGFNFEFIVLAAEEEKLPEFRDVGAQAYWNEPLEKQIVLNDLLRLSSQKHQLRPARIGFPVGQTLKVVKPENIIMVRGDGAYSIVILESGEEIVLSRNLKNICQEIGHCPFMFRTHKSYIVNLMHVLECYRTGGQRIRLTGGHEAGLSADRQEEFLKQLLHF